MIWPFSRAKPELPVPAKLDAAAIVRKARRLEFRVRPDAVADLAGAYLGARPGTGLTFVELKPYEPGDDVRHLDWNVTARQGKPYVRRFVEERSLLLWLVVDVSGSMRFGPEGRTKADRAAQAAALLAAAAVRNGDRVGLALVSDRVEAELGPGSGARHLARLLRTLVASPAASRRSAPSVGLARLRRSARRALIVVLSDFLTPEAPGLWRRTARRHEVVAIRIVEPREETLPAVGLLDLEDSEKGQRRTLDSEPQRVRSAFSALAGRRRAAFQAWCVDVGLTSFEMSTQADPIRPLLQFFRGRSARRVRP